MNVTYPEQVEIAAARLELLTGGLPPKGTSMARVGTTAVLHNRLLTIESDNRELRNQVNDLIEVNSGQQIVIDDLREENQRLLKEVRTLASDNRRISSQLVDATHRLNKGADRYDTPF